MRMQCEYLHIAGRYYEYKRPFQKKISSHEMGTSEVKTIYEWMNEPNRTEPAQMDGRASVCEWDEPLLR